MAVEDDENVTTLGVFENADDAHEAHAGAEEDLAELTVVRFEERSFPADV